MATLKDARFCSPEDPSLYEVYTILTVEGKVVDVNKVITGFRKTDLKGGTGGVYLNDKFVYLKGFAQRSSNEWTGLGQAYPDWMHAFNAKLIRDNHANYVRWMHVSRSLWIPMQPTVGESFRFARLAIKKWIPQGGNGTNAWR